MTTDVISGKIIHVAMSNLPNDEALSYVWGTEDSNESITIDDDMILPIKPNVAAGLRQLRQDLTDSVFSITSGESPLPQRISYCRRIWIDAICINQKDTDERSQEVQLMCDIYTRCNRLVVWLGLAGQYVHLLVSFFHFMEKNEGNKDALKAWVQDKLVSESFRLTFGALLKLLSSSWFERGWILQEYILGAKDSAGFQYAEQQTSQKAFVAAYRTLAREAHLNVWTWRKTSEVLEVLQSFGFNEVPSKLLLRWSTMSTSTLCHNIVLSV